MRHTTKGMYGIFIFSLFLVMGWAVGTVQAKDEILIGTHIPLSGGSASVGSDQKWAYDQAVKQVNDAGGIFVKEYNKKLPVRLIVMDDETNPAKAAAAVEKLINKDKVDLILSGQAGALGVLPGMVAAEKNQVYYHGTVIWLPDFLSQNFKWCTMYFVDIPGIAAMPFEVWNTLPEGQRPKKLGVYLEDNSDGKGMGKGIAALADKYGYQIADTQFIRTGGVNYTPQIMKSKAKGVDAVLCMANVPESVTLVRQMKERGLKLKYFQGWKGTWPNEFWDTLGKDAQNVMCDGFWSMDYPFPGAKELGEQYHKDHGRNSVGVGMYYATCQTLWQAIEKAGTLDGAKIRQAVLDNVFETVNGQVDYDERGVALFPTADFQWRDGKREVLYPIEYATTKVQPMN